jgi:hypothetical protein
MKIIFKKISYQENDIRERKKFLFLPRYFSYPLLEFRWLEFAIIIEKFLQGHWKELGFKH